MANNGWAQLTDHKEKHAFYENLLAGMTLPVGPGPLLEAKEWYVDLIQLGVTVLLHC